MVFLAEFSQQNWQSAIQIAAPRNDTPTLHQELTELLQHLPLRPTRMPEIRSQDHDFILPFLALLTMTAESHPTAYEVIKAACRIGEMLMAFYKAEFNRPRPTQFHPSLLSEIQPVHPSYPSGHALVARLVARCLGEIVESDLQRNWLLQMATRIAENREIAGLHFPSDSEAGRSIADQAFDIILMPNCPRFRALPWGGKGGAAGPQTWTHPAVKAQCAETLREPVCNLFSAVEKYGSYRKDMLIRCRDLAAARPLCLQRRQRTS